MILVDGRQVITSTYDLGLDEKIVLNAKKLG
jgi:hypothetical protein